MGEVVDVRSNRALREMREHGDVDKTCQAAGLTKDELNELCRMNIKFDRAIVECQLEFLEEKAMTEIRRCLKAARALAYVLLDQRHA